MASVLHADLAVLEAAVRVLAGLCLAMVVGHARVADGKRLVCRAAASERALLRGSLHLIDAVVRVACLAPHVAGVTARWLGSDTSLRVDRLIALCTAPHAKNRKTKVIFPGLF